MIDPKEEHRIDIELGKFPVRKHEHNRYSSYHSSYDKDFIKSKIVGTKYLSRGTYTAAAMTSILPLFKEHQRDGEDVTRVRSLVTILLESFSKRITRYCL